jgi:hypothetical protein
LKSSTVYSSIAAALRAKRAKANSASNEGWFTRGWKGGPGRPSGSTNTVNILVRDALLEAGVNVGDFLQARKLCGSEGMVGLFEWAQHATFR